MTAPDVLLIERSGDWLVVVGSEGETVDATATADDLVDHVTQRLDVGKNWRAKIRPANCLLAPASTSCFFVTVEVDRAIDARDHAAMLYQLEDHLPVDAESMEADYVELATAAGSQRRFAAVAIEIERWNQIAAALEAAGMVVRSIVPATVLAARAWCQSNHTDSGDQSNLFFVEQWHCDAVVVRDGRMVAWKRLPLKTDALRRHQRLDLSSSSVVNVVGASSAQEDTIRALYEHAHAIPEPLTTWIVRGARLAVGSPSSQWFELRRGKLGPADPWRPIQNQLTFATFALVVCFLTAVIGSWWRTSRIESEIATIRLQQQELFREAFPQSKLPAALVRRVRSEHQRVLASRGATANIDLPVSAANVLRQLLAALPQEVRYHITKIDIVDGELDLDVQVRSPVDAGALATSLSRSGFDVDPPVTNQKDSRTFESVLEARWIGANDRVDVREQATMDVARVGRPVP